jgi:hypothetical protein
MLIRVRPYAPRIGRFGEGRSGWVGQPATDRRPVLCWRCPLDAGVRDPEFRSRDPTARSRNLEARGSTRGRRCALRSRRSGQRRGLRVRDRQRPTASLAEGRRRLNSGGRRTPISAWRGCSRDLWVAYLLARQLRIRPAVQRSFHGIQSVKFKSTDYPRIAGFCAPL